VQEDIAAVPDIPAPHPGAAGSTENSLTLPRHICRPAMVDEYDELVRHSRSLAIGAMRPAK
jgi:hypothetical protein